MSELDKMPDAFVDALIDKMCEARKDNPDVMTMDSITENMQALSEEEANRLGINIVEEDIIETMVNSEEPPSIEDINALKAAGIYDKYINKINDNKKDEEDAMNAIEEELKQSMMEEDDITEGAVQAQEIAASVTTDVSFQDSNEESTGVVEAEDAPVSEEEAVTISDIREIANELKTTVNDVVSGKALKEELDAITPEDSNDSDMSDEDFNDVPATEIEVNKTAITKELADKYPEVPINEVQQLFSVMERYKAKEKFNVFEALPDSIKNIISSEAMSCGASKSTINFFAKTFINDLVNNTYLDQEIKNFNNELKEVLAPMGNITGTVMDEYSDEIYHKFTDNLEAKADEIVNDNPEEAERLRGISTSFKEAVSLTRVIKSITDTPSNINKAYKTARDNYKRYAESYSKIVSKISPTPRSIDYYNDGVKKFNAIEGYRQDYLETLIVLVANTVIKAVEEGSLKEHIYAYYASNAMYTIVFTANNSEVNKITYDAIKTILAKIEEYMAPLEARNTRKNRKRNHK